jgi:hypothetical protein
MTQITLEVTMPDEFLQAFLQHFRDFDLRHDPERSGRIHLSFGIEAPDIPADAIQAIFSSIRPPFELQTTYPAGKSRA